MNRYDDALRRLNPPRDTARVSLLVQRTARGERATPPTARFDPALGVIGDRWSAGAQPKPDAQVTLMRWDVATLFRPDPAIFGDNLFVTLDTGEENLPAGTLVRVGPVLLEVQAKPHTGCSKFAARAGEEALAVTRAPAWLSARLRGVHLRVVEGGEVALGDEVAVYSRPGAQK